MGGGAIVEGDQVLEAQLQLLIGMGRDPVTGQPLGRAYPQHRSLAERVNRRVQSLNAGLGPVERAEAISRIEAEEATRGTRRTVAGFDLTMSIPKSASVLWAVSDAGTQALIAQAHHDAIADIIAYLEREIAVTRVGADRGDGAVAQADVEGVIATAWDHYDSRAGDPHLHTHVVIANRARTLQDGKWRALDGRPLHAATVALSELHEAVFADHLTRALGVEWELRDRGPDRNPALAITTVPEELVAEFSSRSRAIDDEKNRLIAQYVARHGRQPSRVTIIRLRAQATLATRPPKQLRSLADLTATWRARTTQLLGKDATAWSRAQVKELVPPLLRADDVPLDLIASIGSDVIDTVGEKRSTWRRSNLTIEAARQTKHWRFASTADRQAVVELIVDSAERASLRLTPPEVASSPAVFQFPDGTTRLRPKGSTLFSSAGLLAAEDRLLNHARTTTGPTITLTTVERAARRPDHHGQLLSDDQVEALARIAVSGRLIDLLIGPAGAGKTTAMRAIRRAWEQEHGRGSVVGLAPSATAAQVLSEELAIKAENTAKWWDTHQRTGETFRAQQLVIVDEASLAGTYSLDRISGLAVEAGAKVLLVGDYAQLQSVDAGGSFSLLAHDRDDTPELIDIHRFTNAWEKTASLDLRHGRASAIQAYDDHDRILGGDTEAMLDAAYTAWRADMESGRATVLVADATEMVTALNERARADLILDGRVDPTLEVELQDRTRAGIGDTVITRLNERRLRTGGGWVRNGDRWTVTDLRRDGSLTVRRAGRRWGASLVLPAGYVAQHLDLGYAVTAYRAQGLTTDTAHVLADNRTTRENLYVALTRGRDSNLVYVATDRPDDTHDGPHPGDDPDATARTVLYGVLGRVGAEPSAHEAIRIEQDTWGSIAQLAAEYETIAQAAQHDRWATLVRSCGLLPDQAEAAVASDAFGSLSAELRRAEAKHYNVDVLLPRLVAARGFADADDVAAVLHERLARANCHASGHGHGRRVPRLIAGLIPEATGSMSAEMRHALDERRDLIEQRALAILESATREGQAWVAALGTPPAQPGNAAAWRRHARIVAAYRDRYSIASPTPVDTGDGESTAQRIDAARATAAVNRARDIASVRSKDERPTAAPTPLSRSL
jgi:conjugative relaxase-like TrwC/TraI family protein